MSSDGPILAEPVPTRSDSDSDFVMPSEDEGNQAAYYAAADVGEATTGQRQPSTRERARSAGKHQF